MLEANGTAPGRLARMEWQLLLAALVLAVLAYPLRLRDDLLLQLHSALSPWLWGQVEAALSFYYAPLIFKTVLTAYALLGFILLRALRALLFPEPPALGEPLAALPANGWRARLAGGPGWWLSVALFFAWAAISPFWSVTPLLSGDAALVAAVYGAAFWLLLRRGFSLAELRRLAWLLVGLGAVVIVFLAAWRSPRLLGRWLLNPFTDVRNLMGSLIGHNTAAASYLMLTGFMAFALLLTTRSRWRRGALLVYMAAVIVSILMMQSRSIWALSPPLGWLAYRHAMRRLGRERWRRLPTLLLVMLVLGLLSQAVDRPWNPFFVRDNPLAKRLHAISPEGLLMESRLRLNVIGIRLIPDAPLLGSGLDSFQFVYGRRQGEYFLNHPGSKLNRTFFWSDMAHNEYLQIWIELGTAGLVLCLWSLASLARAGWRLRRGWRDEEASVLHAAFGWGALGFLLHAGFDFPFHVVPLALPGLVCLAGWASARAGDLTPAAVPPGSRESPDGFRPQVVARLTLAAVLLAAAPLAALPFSRLLTGNLLQSEGAAYQAQTRDNPEGLTPDQRRQSIKESMRLFQAAARISPANFLAVNGLAEDCVLLAQMSYRAAREAALPPEQRQAAAAEAVKMNELALDFSARASREFDYFLSVYFMRARIYRQLAELAANFPQSAPRDQDFYWSQYRQMLERTLRYAPTYPEAKYALAEFLASRGADRARVAKMRADIYRENPAFFRAYYVNPAMDLSTQLRYAAALRRWSDILEAVPENPEFAAVAAQASLMMGDADSARRFLAAARGADEEAWRGFGCMLMSQWLGGDWLGAFFNLPGPLTEPWNVADMRGIEDELARRAEWPRMPTHYPRPEQTPAAQWNGMIAETRMMWLMYRQEWSAARQAFNARLGMGTPPSPRFWAHGLYIARALRDAGLERQAYEGLKKCAPEHPLLRDWVLRGETQ